jgi:hypothetical protein
MGDWIYTGQKVQDMLATVSLSCSHCNKRTPLMFAKLAVSPAGRVVPLCSTCGQCMSVVNGGHVRDKTTRELKREVITLLWALRQKALAEAEQAKRDQTLVMEMGVRPPQ